MKSFFINRINTFSNIIIKTDMMEYLFKRNTAIKTDIIYKCEVNGKVIEFNISQGSGVLYLRKIGDDTFFYKSSMIINNINYLTAKKILERIIPNIESYIYLEDEEVDLVKGLIEKVFESVQIDVKYIRLLKDNSDNFYLNAKTVLNKNLNFRYRKIDNEVYYDRFESYWFNIPSARDPMPLNSYMNEALKPKTFNDMFSGFAFILSFRNVYRNANVYQITLYNHDNYNFYYVIDDDNEKEFFMLLKNAECKSLELHLNENIIYYEELVYSESRSKMGQNNFFMNDNLINLMLDTAYRNFLNKKHYDDLGLKYGEELSNEHIEIVKLISY